jgi:hypothetical protein
MSRDVYEALWLRTTEPIELMTMLEEATVFPSPRRPDYVVSERKLRLFCAACACAFRPSSWRRWEGWAEGKGQWCLGLSPVGAAWNWCGRAVDTQGPVRLRDDEKRRRADLLRDTVGNPYRPVVLPLAANPIPGVKGGWDVGGCHWVTPQVLSLATAAYKERVRKCDDRICGGRGHWTDAAGSTETCGRCDRHTGMIDDGSLDPFRLALVADALEEAGCDQPAILEALRSPGAKYRGFWALDLILGGHNL